jgi:hypothetical protein
MFTALDFLQVPMEAYFLALSLVAPSHDDGPWDANASERRSLESRMVGIPRDILFFGVDQLPSEQKSGGFF